VIQMASCGAVQGVRPQSTAQGLPPYGSTASDGVGFGCCTWCFAAEPNSAGVATEPALMTRAFPRAYGNAALDPGPRHHTPSGGGARSLLLRASPAWADPRRRSTGTAR